MSVVIETHNEEETIEVAARLGRTLRPGDVVGLYGELGAGKTRFVRGLAQGMGVDASRVSSPTFVLAQEYAAEAPDGSLDDATMTLVHVDAYRLSGAEEFEDLGLEASLGGAAMVVEWAGRIEAALPDDCLRVTIEHVEGEDQSTSTRRRIRIDAPAVWRTRLEGVFQLKPRRGEGQAPDGATRRCPACAAAVREDTPSFPFCSERCRLADLGKWFDEDYRISRELKDTDLEEFD